LALAVTAGFVEEFVFRGYLQPQFTAMTGSAVIASVLQLAFFVQGHYYQGALRLIPVAVIGLILTLIALWGAACVRG
jgi:membrane protease YdiL (CAAX protease family)